MQVKLSLNQQAHKKTVPLSSFLLLLLFQLLLFSSCENHGFDADRRQIRAKDAVLHKLSKISGFDITGFREDTVRVEGDSIFPRQIQYTLYISYLDSNKTFRAEKGIVQFTPDGETIIHTRIEEP